MASTTSEMCSATVKGHNRWQKSKTGRVHLEAAKASDMQNDSLRENSTRRAACASYVLQHYHSTGCAGGAFSYRAAALNPKKGLIMCTEPREYRETSMEHIRVSKEDKRRGGGPRVGPFQKQIPGESWCSLPKYDFTTSKRSSAFNERMHVEWENHVDHILKNNGELPTASVVAKAGFRSCAPCCRDMLALAKPTNKTFIMVDLAEDDKRGTFHFVTGDKYLPVPKEACTPDEVAALKKVVADAQDCMFDSSSAVYNAVVALGVPVDETAQAMYLGDRALLPRGCASSLKGADLLEVLHAEHFARLAAEYGASIMRDDDRPPEQQEAIQQCRACAKELLISAWQNHLRGVCCDLEAYASAAITPLLPESSTAYRRMRRSATIPRPVPAVHLSTAQVCEEKRRWSERSIPVQRCHPSDRLSSVSETIPEDLVADSAWTAFSQPCSVALQKIGFDEDVASTAAPSTAVSDDCAATDADEHEDEADASY